LYFSLHLLLPINKYNTVYESFITMELNIFKIWYIES